MAYQAIFEEDHLTLNWEDKEFHIFPNCVSLKANPIIQLEFKLSYYNFRVQHFNYYSTGTYFLTPYSTLINSY